MVKKRRSSRRASMAPMILVNKDRIALCNMTDGLSVDVSPVRVLVTTQKMVFGINLVTGAITSDKKKDLLARLLAEVRERNAVKRSAAA